MTKKVFLILLIIICSSLVLASDNEDILLNKYKKLFKQGEYKIIEKELEVLVNSKNNHFGTGSSYLEAVNILADSFLCLDKYTQANHYYWSSSAGLNQYGEYVYKLFEKISIEKGYVIEERSWGNIHERSKYYGGMFTNPSHDRTLYALLSKIYDNHTMEEKRQYFREMALRDENDDWVTKLTEFYAGDISLEELWVEVSEDNIVTISTYAGLLLEFTDSLEKARELYNKALNETAPKNVEKLLAANRLGLFSLERYLENCVSSIETRYVNAIKASSTLIEGENVYSVANLVDENIKTAWVEGKEGSGIGEWVKINFGDIFANISGYNFTEGRDINSINIINGYAKNETIYYANNRVKKLEISFNDGTSFVTELKDGILEQQKIELPEPKKVSSVKFTILDVYQGSKYDDTCISEIAFE